MKLSIYWLLALNPLVIALLTIWELESVNVSLLLYGMKVGQAYSTHSGAHLPSVSLFYHKYLSTKVLLINLAANRRATSWGVPLTFQHAFFSCFFVRFSSVQFSRSVVSNSLGRHEPQHTRPPCPSPSPGGYPNSSPLSRWYHLTISSSVIPFSFCPQYFPASGSLQMSQLFPSGAQSIGVSASTSALLMNTQD